MLLMDLDLIVPISLVMILKDLMLVSFFRSGLLMGDFVKVFKTSSRFMEMNRHDKGGVLIKKAVSSVNLNRTFLQP
jgi:hypothetical protein